MSTWVNGKLAVQRIHGVNGEFSVAKLDSDIGILNVKDSFLDQFDEGVYDGRFAIARVYSHGYAARTGCFIVETRCNIEDYQILSDEKDALDSDFAIAEIDPLDEERQQTPSPSKPEPSTPSECDETQVLPPKSATQSTQAHPERASANSSPEGNTEEPSSLEILFGELWPLGEIVKLDPTSIRTDRAGHRERCKYLNACGYEFIAKTQSWHLK